MSPRKLKDAKKPRGTVIRRENEYSRHAGKITTSDYDQARGNKLFPCSAQLSTKFILFVNFKNAKDCWHFNIYKQDKYNI